MANSDRPDDFDKEETARPVTPSSKKSKSAPARSPVERAVVWGFILLLLVIVSLEFVAHLKYTKAIRAVEERQVLAEDGSPFMESEFYQLLGGKQPTEKQEITHPVHRRCRQEIYQWNGPLRKRTLTVYFMLGEDSEVLAYETSGTPPKASDTKE